VTPTGEGLPVVRSALLRRRRGLRETRFPPGVGESRGPQRPRRGGAQPLAGGGGGGNDGVLPLARLWGAVAPLQDSVLCGGAAGSSAVPIGGRLTRGARGGAFVFRRRRRAMLAHLTWGLPVVGCGCRWPQIVRHGAAFPPGLREPRRPHRLRRFSGSPVSRVDALWAASVVRRGRRSLRWGECSTTPGALYSWLWALVRGSRVTGGVSPLWRAAAACERLRCTCPGELVGLSCADSGAG